MAAMDINTLCDTAPFELSSMKTLEAHVSAQKSGSAPYNFKANKSLLKSYQCNGGDSHDAAVVADVLVLGLMQLPSTDFFELSYLVPTRLLPQSKGEKTDAIKAGVATIAVVLKGAAMLEHAKNTEFWAFLAEEAEAKKVFSGVTGFETAVRGYILAIIAESFRNTKKDMLMSLLGFANAEAAGAAFLAQSSTVDQAASAAAPAVVTFVQKAAEDSNTRSDLNAKVGDMQKLVDQIRLGN